MKRPRLAKKNELRRKRPLDSIAVAADGASDAAAEKPHAAAPDARRPHLRAAPRSADAQQRLSAIHHRFTISPYAAAAPHHADGKTHPNPVRSRCGSRTPRKSGMSCVRSRCGAGTTLDELKDQICAKTGLQARILVMAKRYEADGDLDEAQRAALRAQAYVNWVRGGVEIQIRRRTASARWREVHAVDATLWSMAWKLSPSSRRE